MRLLDRFRRPDRARARKIEDAERDAKPLPQKIEPSPARNANVAQDSLSNRAREEDAA